MGRRTFGRWLSAALALLLAGCAGIQQPDGLPAATVGLPVTPDASPATTESPPTPTDAGGQPTQLPEGERPWDHAYGSPNPVAVSVELGPITLTSRVTVEHGGLLSLLGANGTFYKFEVPAGAVLSDLDVTMTEVASIAGSPLGTELVGAVALQPAGLLFLEPATLTITPPAPITVEQEGPFSAESDGADFHLYPLDPDPSALRMDVFHFSLYGLFRTEAEGRAQLAAATSSFAEAQLQVELSKVSQAAREAGGTLDAERVRAIFSDYRQRVLRPLLGQARWWEDVFVEATQKWMAYERLRVRFGVPVDLADVELIGLWSAGYRNYVERQVEHCQNHALGGIVDLLKIRRLAEILRVPSSDYQYDTGEMEKIEKCATFTLEMFSSTENRLNTCVIGAGRIDETANVFATVEIRPLSGLFGGDPRWGLTDAEGPWVGPMEWGKATHTAICQMISAEIAECTSKMAGYGPADDFTVLKLDWDLNLTRFTRPEGRTPARLNLRGMLVQPGDPELMYDTDCEGGWAVWGGGGSATGLGSASWRAIWRTLTADMPCRDFAAGPEIEWSPDEAPEASEAYYLDCWEFEPHGDVIARWEQEAITQTLGMASEKTRFTLRHTPRR